MHLIQIQQHFVSNRLFVEDTVCKAMLQDDNDLFQLKATMILIELKYLYIMEETNCVITQFCFCGFDLEMLQNLWLNGEEFSVDICNIQKSVDDIDRIDKD